MSNNKHFRLTPETLNPLFKSTIGFDQIVDGIFKEFGVSTTGYPPYNITRTIKESGTDEYNIVLALAGFTEDDIEISVENNTLVITGNSSILGDDLAGVEYLHKGIAARKFTRSFRLAEHVEISNAVLKNGILTVSLTMVIPESAKPKTIKITQQ